MKLLHTSDWHLGMLFRGGDTYRKDQEYAINQIYQIAVDEKADAILIAGDIFDKSIASQEAIQLYDRVMTHICIELDIPVFLIAGNHDGAERISQCNELLKKSGLYIAGALERKVQSVSMGDVDIYMLPWISTDKVKYIYPDEAENITTLESAYKVVLDKYRKSFVKGRRKILLAHAFITDAETSVSDRAAEVGRATMVGSYVFEGFDYVALGHLHGPQQVNEHIRYCGTPMAYSFGREEKQEKSVTIIDTDSMELKIIPLHQLHKRITLSGTYDELMRADYDDEILNGYVRLEISDKYVSMESIADFREKYCNLLEISGKSLDISESKITMTIEEFENASSDPESVFIRFCNDMDGENPDEHLLKLYRSAVKKYAEGVTKE